MGGKVYDRRPLQVDRDPLKQLAVEVGRLKKLEPIDMLEHWVEQVRDFIAEAIKRVTGIDLLALAPFMGAIGLNVLQSPEEVWEHIASTFLDPLAWLRKIPIGSLSAATPNLLAGAITNGDGVWTPDAAGAWHVTANGAIRELISERIELDVGRTVDAEVVVKYTGLTAAVGTFPIRLSWIGWNGDDEVAGGDFDFHQPAGASSAGITLDGSLKRLATDAWDTVSVVLKVTAGALAGDLVWSGRRATKPDKLPKNLVDGLETALAQAGQTIRDAICNALGFGGTGKTDADVIHALNNIPKAAVEGVQEIGDNLRDGFIAWYNHWFKRTDGNGSVAQIQQVAESVHDAVFNGYNVHPIIANEVGWVVPAHVECLMISTGGGEKGENGTNGGSAIGKNGGRDGSWLVQTIDLTGITALDTTIGTQGVRSVVRAANAANPHTGAIVFQSPEHGSLGSIATPLGYTPTTSTPGRGGNGGGMGTNRDVPTAGGSTAVAAGGAPGGNNGTWGTNGQDGQSVSPGSNPKCGGSGGGGGGGAVQTLNVGGNGGAGGYPGGAGGAGGNCNGTVNQVGVGGPGAIGCVWILTRG